METKEVKRLIILLQITNIIGIILLFIIFLSANKAHSKEIILHTTKDVYRYNQYAQDDTIILPDHERVSVTEMEKEMSRDGRYITREGKILYKGDNDNTIFMEEDGDEE